MSIDRSPGGRFIGRGEVLSNWLPLMLGWSYCGRGLEEMLRIAQRWCTIQAAEQLRLNSSYIVENDAEAKPWSLWGVREMEKWRLRREVLIDASSKLSAINTRKDI